MGSVPPELSLDWRPTFVPKTISDFLYEVSTIGNAADKLSRFDEFLRRLEEEMRKIDAFKRELPLCMFLLNDAILNLKEESAKLKAPISQPLLADFIPLTKECDLKKDDKKEKECRDKKTWMSSVQLWNTDNHPTTNDAYEQRQQHYELENKKCEEEGQSVPEDPFQSRTNGDNRCRAFLALSTYSSIPATPVTTKEEKEDSINGLSLMTPGIRSLREGYGSSGSRSSSSRAVSSSTPCSQPIIPTGHQQQSQKQVARKQRRCWSPELHRRFVNALQQLGGSLAATPKQIRELMQVDGLTNDEVKSHLQKYRLHTRRTPATAATPANQSVFLGGLWMSPDQHNESSKDSSSGSGSPQGPFQLAASGGGMSRTEGDSMEDDEDDESFSWKSHIHKTGKDV